MNRIMKEIANVQKSTEMYIDFDEKDAKTFKVMFFGPPDSAYHHGIFIFEMKLSDNYPFTVPSVKFLTGGMVNARVHPNLYQDGKVCLSILNTWATNEWSPLLTIEKVFITIRALLDNHPIVHEPAYKNYPMDHRESIAYRLNASYYTLKSIYDVHAFYKNYHPESPFYQIICNYLKEHSASIKEMAEDLKNKIDPKTNYNTFHHTGNISKTAIDNLINKL
jgi:ubiquitin-protein ligase